MDSAPVTSDIERLFSGPIHWFSDWPTGDVPRHGAVVYTIWDRLGGFIYVGMSGRGHKEGDPLTGKGGPWGRLNSHASGRRSGDQFCIYVHDWLVLPTLHNRLHEVAARTLKLDHATREYIKCNLGFRWAVAVSGSEATRVEAEVRRGQHAVGPPLLNPYLS